MFIGAESNLSTALKHQAGKQHLIKGETMKKYFGATLMLTLLCLGCGYKSPMSASQQPGTAPVVMQLVPNTANSGDPGFTLTVNGNGFNQDAVISVNGQKQTTTFMTANQLTTTIPASAIATPGTLAVTVTNPGHAAGGIYGTGGTASATSSPKDFTIN
jgi:IPT/TIG domain